MATKKNKKVEICYLVNTEGKKYKYVTKHRNNSNKPGGKGEFTRLSLKKYNPITRRREIFEEKKK